MPWIYNEDSALKKKLQGLTVTDATAPPGGRAVPVRYRLPEDELATLTYPCIIIEHIGLYPDPSREHRGYIQIPYAPEGKAIWWAENATAYDPSLSPYWGWFPLPYNFDYRIVVYTRKMAEHLQPLMTTLAQQPYLPYHWGQLDVPQDGTYRSMFLLGGPEIEYGKDQDGKRLFRATYMIRVLSEIVNAVVPPPITDINLDLGVYRDVTDITTEEIENNVALISTGPMINFNVTAPS